MRSIQAPLTLPKHPELLKEINETCINIKLHHVADDKDFMNVAALNQARASHPKPSWGEIANILDKCYRAINEQRDDPRKY